MPSGTTLKKAISRPGLAKKSKGTLKKSSSLKGITSFRPMIRSRHNTHSPLRTQLPLMPFRSVIRLGSTTELEDTMDKGGKRVEINSTEAIRNSSSKVRMKTCFVDKGVITAPVFKLIRSGNDVVVCDIKGAKTGQTLDKLRYPIIAKLIFGSRGVGMELIKGIKELKTFIVRKGTEISSYIFEDFLNYSREYRLHVTEDGCFYTCRKMLKKDTEENKKYFRNDSNSVWIMEENPDFDKPSNWKDIEKECVKALKSIGLDFGACDVKVQSSSKGEKAKFFIVEINSAPSFGDETLKRYLKMLPALLKKKQISK